MDSEFSTKEMHYTLQSNNVPMDLCNTIEQDSGVPAAEQCLVVGGLDLALGHMALLCEYSANGKDLHLQLRKRKCTKASCESVVLNKISLKWMDQTSTALSVDGDRTTIASLKQRLYDKYGLPMAS